MKGHLYLTHDKHVRCHILCNVLFCETANRCLEKCIYNSDLCTVCAGLNNAEMTRAITIWSEWWCRWHEKTMEGYRGGIWFTYCKHLYLLFGVSPVLHKFISEPRIFFLNCYQILQQSRVHGLHNLWKHLVWLKTWTSCGAKAQQTPPLCCASWHRTVSWNWPKM